MQGAIEQTEETGNLTAGTKKQGAMAGELEVNKVEQWSETSLEAPCLQHGCRPCSRAAAAPRRVGRSWRTGPGLATRQYSRPVRVPAERLTSDHCKRSLFACVRARR
jgi:hypothetical protein